MEDKKEEHPPGLEVVRSGATSLNQIRQLSIPMWLRLLTLVLAVGTLLVGVLLVWKGWVSCTAACNEKWLENGTHIVGAAFVPVVIIVYLIFAETGVKALVRKTGEMLERTVPDALRIVETDDVFAVANEIERCDIETSHVTGVPRARYRLTATRGGKTAELNLMLDLNVSKANVVFFIPAGDIGVAETAQIMNRFKATIEGAEHEGYTFDKKLSKTLANGQEFFMVVARRKLNDNFLWDPGHKLHFAQDLRMFVHSIIHEGWDLLAMRREDGSAV